MRIQATGVLFLVAICYAKKEPECDVSMKNGCPKIFQPLCANNDKTYANLCELCVRSYLNQDTGLPALRIQYEGECSNGEEPLNEQRLPHVQPNCAQYEGLVGCNKILQPVCGTNGRSYGNECVLCMENKETGSNVLVAQEGNCKKS